MTFSKQISNFNLSLFPYRKKLQVISSSKEFQYLNHISVDNYKLLHEFKSIQTWLVIMTII